MSFPRRLLCSLAAVAWCTACSRSDTANEPLLAAIRSDLDASAELAFVRIESLDPSGEDAFDTVWLRVATGCAAESGTPVILGTFELARGALQAAHLRVSAFAAADDDEIRLVLQRRVDISLARRSGFVSIDLIDDPGIRVLPVEKRLARGERDLACLVAADAPFATAPDASRPDADGSEPEVPCLSGDDQCPDGCTYIQDADCRSALGKACTVDGSCAVGAFCVDGVCCESLCTGECMRCDMPSSVGTCRDVMVGREVPLNAVAYAEECLERHLMVSAAADRPFSWQCAPTFANCDASAHAIDSVVEDGCDTPLGTASDCAGCGDRCPYQHCANQTCSGEAQGVLGRSVSINLTAYTAQGVLATLTPQATVRALGALVDTRFARGKVKLALYGDLGQTSVPSVLLAATAELDAFTDSGFIGELAGPFTNRVEGPLDTPVVVDPSRTYFVFAVTTVDNVVWGELNEDFVFTLRADGLSFLTSNPDPSQSAFGSQPSLYAVTTPQP